MQEPLFVGRNDELKQLRNHQWKAMAGQGRVVFITGEAGIGKTELVKHFRTTVLNENPRVQYAEAKCKEIVGERTPYAPFIDLLNDLIQTAGQQGDTWLSDYVHQIGPDVLQFIPVAGDIASFATKTGLFVWERWRKTSQMAGSSQSQFGQQNLFSQFADAFCNIAGSKNPLMLFVDDWQWADTTSTSLLYQLAHRLPEARILLLVAYRPQDARVSDGGKGHPVLEARDKMVRYDLCSELPLSFLEYEEVSKYLTGRFPECSNFDPTFVEWLVNISDGNALFLVLYVDHLIEEKLLTPNGHFWGDYETITPPKEVNAVIRDRLRLLSEDDKELLADASVEGEQFTCWMLGRLEGIELRPLLKRLRKIATDHQLIVSLGRQNLYEKRTTAYRFVHTLVHQTFYGILEEEEREEVACFMLAALEKVYVGANRTKQMQLAIQMTEYAARCSNAPAEAHYASDAARLAIESYAYVEAGKHSSTGLRACERISDKTPDLRILQLDLLTSSGEANEYMGNWQGALEMYEQAYGMSQALDMPIYHKADMARRIGRQYSWGDNLDLALEWMEKGRALVTEQDDIDSRQVLALINTHSATIYYMQNEYQTAEQLCQQGLALLDPDSASASKAEGYNLLGASQDALGKHSEAKDAYNASIAQWMSLDNVYEIRRVESNLAVVLYELGDWTQAREMHEHVLDYFNTKVHDRQRLAVAATNMGYSEYLMGNYDAAAKEQHLAIQLADELGILWLQILARVNLGWVFVSLLAWGEAQTIIEESLNIQKEIDVSQSRAESLQILAYVALGQGQKTLAQDKAEEALSIAASEEEGKNPLEVAKAERILGEVLRIVGDHTLASVHLHNSLKILLPLRNRLEIARTRRQLALLHRDMGTGNEEPLYYILQALTTFVELGAQGEIWSMVEQKETNMIVSMPVEEAATLVRCEMLNADWAEIAPSEDTEAIGICKLQFQHEQQGIGVLIQYSDQQTAVDISPSNLQ